MFYGGLDDIHDLKKNVLISLFFSIGFGLLFFVCFFQKIWAQEFVLCSLGSFWYSR